MAQKPRVLLLNAPYTPTNLNFEFDLVQLHNVSEADIRPELSLATIILTAAVRISYDALINHAPHLRAIVCMGTGTDNISLEACRERGITLCNTPAQNTATVCEHAFALLAALKRKLLPLDRLVRDGTSWPAAVMALGVWEGGPPRLNGDEVLGVVGYGGVGRAVEGMGRALGMDVRVVERKGVGDGDVRDGRMGFDAALRECTALVLTAPLDESTRDMIGRAELAAMRSDALLVNVGRGGLVDEAALAEALKEGGIGGAATDVFETEPATPANSPLLMDPDIPNLVLTPHVAWYSAATLAGARRAVNATLEAFVAGAPQNVVIRGSR